MDCRPEGYRFRLVGSDVVSRAGKDGTGRLVNSAPYPAVFLDAWLAAMDDVAVSREPRLMRAALKGGGCVLTLLLPLVESNGSTEMILGGAFPEGATEGPWLPISMERVDIEAPSNAAESDQPVHPRNILRPNWSTRYQT